MIDSTAVLRNKRLRDVPEGNPGNSVFIYHLGTRRSPMKEKEPVCGHQWTVL